MTALIIIGCIVGYLVIGGLVALVTSGGDPMDDEIIAGIFWPIVVPFLIAWGAVWLIGGGWRHQESYVDRRERLMDESFPSPKPVRERETEDKSVPR